VRVCVALSLPFRTPLPQTPPLFLHALFYPLFCTSKLIKTPSVYDDLFLAFCRQRAQGINICLLVIFLKFVSCIA
jgi:hypothetical protein